MARKSNKPRKPADKKSSRALGRGDVFREEDIDDEVDAFHKQRDKVSLNVNEDAADSDEEMEQSVFDLEDREKSDEDDDDNEDEDDSVDEEVPLKGLAAKIARQAKYLAQKFGKVDETNDDDIQEEDDEKRTVWGRRKGLYYENVEHQASDEEHHAEEEVEVVKIQKEKAEYLTEEDFGCGDDDLVDDDFDGKEKSLQDVFAGKRTVDAVDVERSIDGYEKVREDLIALTKEEQMEVVYSFAPELVGLLTELDMSLSQLKQIKPMLLEIEKEKTKGAMNYLEVKVVLLLTYCQAIVFYLLLKSEGQSVRDHPVIARLVEIKNLLDKIDQISPLEVDVANHKPDPVDEPAQHSVPMDIKTDTTDASARPSETADVNETFQSRKVNISKDLASKNKSKNLQNIQVSLKSMEMQKVRAGLEEKFRKKGIYSRTNQNSGGSGNHAVAPTNRRLETHDDFDDEVLAVEQLDSKKKKLSQLVSNRSKKLQPVSGDDDLPKRDDIGERRRKYELQFLARTGVTSESGGSDDIEVEDRVKDTMSSDVESEDEFYKKVKKQRTDKVTAKAQIYARSPAIPNPSSEVGEDDKRQITQQMEKNRGLTRNRKKLTKNPRKKYKLKYSDAVTRRKGQVRDIRKPTGPYGGETSGVNVNVSRSIRFKS